MKIAGQVVKFNVYSENERLIGISGDVKLPDIKAMTTTMDGAGFSGSLEVPIPGQIENEDFELPFANLDEDIFNVMKLTDQVVLTLRAAQQVIDKETGKMGMQQVRVVVRGFFKEFKGGSVKIGEQGNPSLTMALTYYLLEINSETKLEFDRLNSKLVVNGEDVMKEIRDMC